MNTGLRNFYTKFSRNLKILSDLKDYFFNKEDLIPRYRETHLESIFKDTEISERQIKLYLEELKENSLIYTQYNLLVNIPRFENYKVPDRCLALYILIRYYNFQKIVETGSYIGQTTFFILLALDKNKKGVLHSFDTHPNNIGWYPKLPEDYKPGYIVPESLDDRWKLHEGYIEDTLKEGLESIGSIDLFFHDSDHSQEQKDFEFNTVKSYLCDKGVLASHDVGEGNKDNGSPTTTSFKNISNELNSEIHGSMELKQKNNGSRVFAFLYIEEK